uniref:Superkiller protein 3 n=1 Tax=Kwoniella bestiolae CBS 10118 TaxID=1296100 RepID=A0A1B9G105_9TREE|nr:superkiller protein 3 [Kwoniella bestiolae CBS 10118]OCF24705.1 superkiller protein 3 [Kwoniella bestiolae CBS 10118]
MSATKKALKSIKLQLEEKNSEAALYEATNLLKSIGEDAPEAAQVLIFRGLALTQLQRNEEAEKSYIHAYKLQPSNPLASLYRALDQLLPSSPLVPLLQSVPPSGDSYVPFPQPIYPPSSAAILPSLPTPLPHVLHLVASLPLLINLLVRAESIVYTTTEQKVKVGRQRLGAGPEKEVRKKVDAEVLGSEMGMRMVELLKEVGSHPNVDEDVRREVEIREFNFWRKLGACLPSKQAEKPDAKKTLSAKPKDVQSAKPGSTELPSTALFKSYSYTTPNKDEALSKTNDLANGFVLLGITGKGAEEGWSWVLEGKDEPSLFYDIELLHKYAKAFPESKMTDFIDDYCRWFKLPLPEPEEEEEVPVPTNGNESFAQKANKKPRNRRGRNGMNAKERRKARRAAGKEGLLAEDLDQEERDELVSGMTKLVDQLPKSIFAHRVIARISLQEEDWANAIAFGDKAKALVKELENERGITLPNVRASLDTTLGLACVPYFAPKHHPRAIRLLDGVLKGYPDNKEARFARARIHQAAGKWSYARKEFQTLIDAGGDEKDVVAAKEELGWCLVNEGELEKGREILEEVVEIRDARNEQEGKDDEAYQRARAWCRLGRTEWMIGVDDESRQHAEEWFMASIRALPTFPSSYTSLGICYSSATPPDQERALKCFQKAFELDATETEAAHRLAVGYANEDEWSLVRTIAMRVMEGEGGLDGVAGGEVMNAKGRFAPQNGWAWKALGSTEVHYKNYAKAAQAYQIALRGDPTDVSMWVLLGESYVKCGRHIAGLKTLNHALELQSDNWRAYFNIGDTQSQLGAFDKAIEAYEKVLSLTETREIGIIAALAEANLSLGRQTAAGGFRQRSRNALHAAIRLATEVLKDGRSHRAWAWKTIGDATFELSNQESSIEEALASSEVIQPVLQHLVEDDTDRRSQVEGLGHAANLLQSSPDLEYTLETSIFAFAYRAYLLKNEPRVADPALYDFASSLHTLALRLPDGDNKTSCLKAAIAAIRLALERDAGDERLWNALGVICGTAGPQVAQHAFVVSLELYSKDPIVWANLGYLYLRLDDRELANQCFLKSQITDPDYAPAWFGQGMLAERNGDKQNAKALYSHSVTLSAGSLLEADLALAIATLERFLVPGGQIDINLLHQPAFALRHYCHQRPNDFAAAHLYAMICERLGLADEAATSLERAAAVLEEDFERTESADIESRYAIALCNLGRVQLAAKKYQASLDTLNNCWELISGSADGIIASLKPQCRLLQGLVHYWLGQIDESLEAFQNALDEAAASQDLKTKEEVAVLLSRTLWGLGGDDAKETAKSNLMECLSQEKPSLKVISTLAAIAVISSDPDLVEAAISELSSRPVESRIKEDPAGQSDLVLYLHALVDGNSEEAHKILEGAVQTSPGNIKSRNRLAEALIQSQQTKEAIAVLENEGRVEDVESRAKMERLKGTAEILDGEEGGMSRLQKSVVLAPWEEEGWNALGWGRRLVAEAEAE